jgi:molybdopterin-guanine dinucleotide biosynthesis protein
MVGGGLAVRVLHVAGASNTGKTRLLEALLPLIGAAAVIKWTHHPLGPDKSGSDTDRLGSQTVPVVLAHPDGFVVRPGAADRFDVYDRAAQWLDDQSLLVVEGDKHGFAPVIWLGADVPQDVKPCLVIGPQRPRDVPWHEADIPLSKQAAKAAAMYIRDSLEQFTYYLPRSFHAGIH